MPEALLSSNASRIAYRAMYDNVRTPSGHTDAHADGNWRHCTRVVNRGTSTVSSPVTTVPGQALHAWQHKGNRDTYLCRTITRITRSRSSEKRLPSAFLLESTLARHTSKSGGDCTTTTSRKESCRHATRDAECTA